MFTVYALLGLGRFGRTGLAMAAGTGLGRSPASLGFAAPTGTVEFAGFPLKLLAAVGGTMSWAAAGCGALNLDLDGGRRELGPGVN